MPILPWACAHGDAAPVTLECAATVDLAPADDSIDTNLVVVIGSGEISDFGSGPGGFIRKRVIFRPTQSQPEDPPPTITLQHNPPLLSLSTGSDRTIDVESYGEYICNDQGNWFELFFTGTGATATENRLIALERRLNDVERRLSKRSPEPTGD